MTKRPIIIDTDPGIDDAVAIAIALFNETLDVRLISTVNGNVSLDKVTYNALRLLKFFDKKVPVAKGAAQPLIVGPADASEVHGETGMDGYTFEEPDENLLLKDHAVIAMYKEIMNSDEKITLLPIGPLTNIALLLRLYPEVRENIDEIILMGGSASRGNASVMAEFNIYADPEAAKIVFSSGLPIVMAGLDVGKKALIYPEDSEKLRDMNKTGNMMYHLFKRYRSKSFDEALRIYDSCAVGYLLKPDLFETVDTYVDVELAGEHTKGATVVDLENLLQKESNVKVCMDVNSDEFRKWFIESVSKCI